MSNGLRDPLHVSPINRGLWQVAPTHVDVIPKVEAAVLLFPLDLAQTVGEERLEIGHGVVGESTCFACVRRRLYHRCYWRTPSRWLR